MAALTSSTMSLRYRPYSGCPDDSWLLSAMPEMPSMSTEM